MFYSGTSITISKYLLGIVFLQLYEINFILIDIIKKNIIVLNDLLFIDVHFDIFFAL